MKILFIDDDLDIIDHYSRVIKSLYPDSEIIQMSDSKKAYDMIVKEQVRNVDLIITDYKMPEITGGDIFQAARLNILDIPILILTALDPATLNTVSFFHDTGRNNKIIQKPASEQDLEQAISFCLTKKPNSFTYKKA